MAGAAIRRARKEAGVFTPGEAYTAGRTKVANWLDECLELTMTVARGVHVERTVMVDGLPEQRVYRQPPNLIALFYLIDRAMGKTRTETNEVDDRLNTARAMFIEQQMALGWLDAQVKDMNARGDRALMEAQMWPKQFVTEEEQQAQLRDLSRAATKAVTSLTPEALKELMPELTDPASALERLKGRIGRDQADILMDAMSGGKEVADDDTV